MSSFTGKGEKTKGKGGAKGSKTKGASNDAQKVLVFRLFFSSTEVITPGLILIPSCTRAVEGSKQAASSTAATVVGHSPGSCVGVHRQPVTSPSISERHVRSSIWPMSFAAVLMIQKQSSRLGVRPPQEVQQTTQWVHQPTNLRVPTTFYALYSSGRWLSLIG